LVLSRLFIHLDSRHVVPEVAAGSLIGQRTAKGNQIRGLAAEYGVVAPKDLAPLRRAIPEWLEDAENGLTARFRALLAGLWEELRGLDERLEGLDREIEEIAETHPDAKRLRQLRGVGPLIATALVARFGDGSHYGRGRPGRGLHWAHAPLSWHRGQEPPHEHDQAGGSVSTGHPHPGRSGGGDSGQTA